MDFRHPIEAVIPTLDADVLGVLARADAEMTGRQIQRLARRGSPQGIRNAADRLTRQGVVLRRPAGSAYLYRLNRDHVAAPWVEGLASLPEQIFAQLRSSVGAWTQAPALIMVFGSVASGQATPDSDLDLLIVRPAGCDPDSVSWQEQIGGLAEQATALTGNSARIVEYSEDELARAHAEPLLADVFRDGIELYGSRRILRGPIKRRSAR